MGQSVKISGLIIAYNEEVNIVRCIKSLQGICDEIIVVDSYSKDNTKILSIEAGATVIENPFDGHIEQKNFAISKASYAVVLSLDADEALSQELQKSILAVKKDFTADAYLFNRYNNYCGQWINHCGWYPDAKVRLLKKEKGAWGGTNPHDCIEMKADAVVKKLSGDLLHYSYSSMEDHIFRSMKYAKISAYAMKKQNRKSSLFKMLSSSCFRFVQDYIFKRGFLDGFYGLVICTTNAYTSFLKYAYLHNLNQGKNIE
jgi:glycosyltransferase involved in cell wall biosynthesis